MSRTILTLALLFSISTSLLAQRHFPHPDRIRYDGQCMTIEGKDTFILSAAFHYFRAPKALWPERFRKIKEAGCNVVETYVAWNWHERDMPASVDDFSKVDMTDLVDWMRMAHEHGLYTIIRPGPYICAEWADGGFPTWLNLKRPAGYEGVWLRSDDPEFLRWSKHWFDACVPVIAAEQITRKKPGEYGVILFQIENEYDLIQGFSEEQRVRHLKALYQYSVDNGIDVPIFTCWTRQIRGSADPQLRNVFDAPNSYVRWNLAGAAQHVTQVKQQQPDAPGMIAEMQGGWFAQVGGQLSHEQDGVTPEQCQGITLMAMANGATILNYYMFFGGTNFGDWAARTQPTTYDYFAPLREHGGVNEKYQKVQAIGNMLKQHAPQLARTERVETQVDGFHPDIWGNMRRSADGTNFIFLWNRNRQAPRSGSATINAGQQTISISYDLAPFDFKVLVLAKDQTDSSHGTWYPQPVAPIERPPLPQPVQVTAAQVKPAPEPTQWVDIKPGDNLLHAGVYDSRYVMYRSKFRLTAEQFEKFKTLQLDQAAGDPVVVRVNGAINRSGNPVIGDQLRAGENEITILYENQGYPNFGPAIEHTPGITRAALTYSRTPDVMLTKWRARLVEARRPTTQVSADFDDSDWPGFTLDAKTAVELTQPIQPGAEDPNAAGRILFGRNNARAVFRATLDVTREMLDAGQTQIVFERIDDSGTVFINGEQAGRINTYERPLSIDAKQWLKVGTNVIAVSVQNRNGIGGLTRPVRLVGTNVERIELPLQLATELPAPEGPWNDVTLGSAESTASSDALMSWHEFEFELPRTTSDAWIPWLARIHATGNGMIWLNGHHLGRYWAVGPQRDFYLPECWLQFGAGKKNIIRMSLRPTDQPLMLESVTVMPYPDAAERR